MLGVYRWLQITCQHMHTHTGVVATVAEEAEDSTNWLTCTFCQLVAHLCGSTVWIQCAHVLVSICGGPDVSCHWRAWGHEDSPVWGAQVLQVERLQRARPPPMVRNDGGLSSLHKMIPRAQREGAMHTYTGGCTFSTLYISNVLCRDPCGCCCSLFKGRNVALMETLAHK